jgi:hypothetical protein
MDRSDKTTPGEDRMNKRFRRKVVGETEIITDRVTRKKEYKYVTNQKIERRIQKAYILECEHKVDKHKEGTKSCYCYDCYNLSDEGRLEHKIFERHMRKAVYNFKKEKEDETLRPAE